MTNKFKLFLPLSGIVAVIGMASAASAFDGGCNHGQRFDGGRHGNVVERMQSELQLSDEQTRQIRAIFKTSREESKKQRSEHRELRKSLMQLDPSSPDYMQQADQLARRQAEAVANKIRMRARTRQQIHAILTPEQREKARELRQQRMERLQERRESKERFRNDKRS